MHSSAASTSGGASSASVRCERIPKPRNVCRVLCEGHVRISLDAPDLVAVSITELSYASGEVRDGYLRNKADREDRVDRADRRLVPDNELIEARLLVAAAISFIEDVARTWHLTRYVGVADEITAIALSILTSGKS